MGWTVTVSSCLLALLVLATAVEVEEQKSNCCQCAVAEKGGHGLLWGVGTGLASLALFAIPGVGQAAAVVSAVEATIAAALAAGAGGYAASNKRCCSCSEDAWDPLLKEGDALMLQNKCAEALRAYEDALSKGPQEGAAQVIWRIYRANVCMGKLSPALPGPGDSEASSCLDKVYFLKNEKLLEDFLVLSERNSHHRAKHVDEWLQLFGLRSTTCNAKTLKKAWRNLLKVYHPDHFRHAPQCAHVAALWISAGYELLSSRGCQSTPKHTY